MYDRSSSLIYRAIDTPETPCWKKVPLLHWFIVFLLHVRSALVAILMLPVGILAAFIGMHLLGQLQHRGVSAVSPSPLGR